MIEDITVRNMSPATQRSYIGAVLKFSRNCSGRAISISIFGRELNSARQRNRVRIQESDDSRIAPGADA
jgi:hypothetical protein